MLKFDEDAKFYLITGHVDFRGGINSLVYLISSLFPETNLFEKNVYIFMAKNKKTIKFIFWEKDGFWLITHKLSEGKYQRIKGENELKNITHKQLMWLIDELEIEPKKFIKKVDEKVII